MKQAPKQHQQLRLIRLNRLLAVLVIVFALGMLSLRGAALGLSATGHGLHSVAHWLIECKPSEFIGGDALDAYTSGYDPDVFSPADKVRLKKLQQKRG